MSNQLPFSPHSSLHRAVLGGLGAALLLSACSKPAPPDEPIRAVRVTTVAIQTMQGASEFSGEVRARVESRLGFRVAGKLIKRQVEVGQSIKTGQILAQLDAQDYKLAADATRAQLAAATTNRDVTAADYKRFKDLKDQNFISTAELDRRHAALKAAQAQVDQAQAQLAAQNNQAAYTSLVADVSGVVTAVESEVGQVLGAGTPVVRVAQDGPRDVVFYVPEDKVAAMAVSSSVSVKAWSGTASLKGVVREVAASADPATRTYLVKVSLESDAALPLGSTVTVTPKVLSRVGIPVIKLPTSALRQEGKGSAVWLLDAPSMTVRSRTVQVATADGNEVVIAAGLEPGMQVVVAGVHVLSQGQKVRIFKEKGNQAQVPPTPSAIISVAPTPATSSSAPVAK